MNFKEVSIVFLSFTLSLSAQQGTRIDNTSTTPPLSTGQVNGDNRPISTAVPFLNINPDPRSGGMGDAGVATSSTTNDIYWNLGKLAFNEKNRGGLITVNPWLRNIVSDMWISNVAAHYKRKKEEAFGINMTYFSLGKIDFRDQHNVHIQTFSPREFSLGGAYSRKLSEKMGLGLGLKYVHSNLTGSAVPDVRPLNTAAVDIGWFYTTPIQVKTSNSKLSFGANISNLGGKIKYISGGSNAKKDFLPMNLRLGSAYTHELDMYNKLTIALDFNKLLTPSPLVLKNAQGIDTALYYPDKGLMSGLFGSFTDAPGGLKEELREVTTSIGLEYVYNDIFIARAGYFNESKYKGGRKYMTFGFGLRYNNYGFDFAYLVAQSKANNALGGTLRFLVAYTIDVQKAPRDEKITE